MKQELSGASSSRVIDAVEWIQRTPSTPLTPTQIFAFDFLGTRDYCLCFGAEQRA